MTESGSPRLVLVLGVGRSGTSLITRILGELGLQIPQPEIEADETNPRGFGEPAWVVSFHRRIMRRLRVTVFDARPAAWDVTGAVARDPEVRTELRDWLATQVQAAPATAVKDPRVAWFLPLWLDCAREAGASTASVTMLRHPAEILTSARKSYGTWQTDASRAASWLNVMLETERATRGTPRAFLRYEDALADWRAEMERAGEALALPLLCNTTPEQAAKVDEFVDPSLRRVRAGWDEVTVPASVRELAERTWEELQLLVREDGDAAAPRNRLDSLREDYVQLYEEAASIAQSSVTAVKPRPARGRSKPPADARTSGSATAVRRWISRRLPERYRKRLRVVASAVRQPR